jgi:hypothetical protein
MFELLSADIAFQDRRNSLDRVVRKSVTARNRRALMDMSSWRGPVLPGSAALGPGEWIPRRYCRKLMLLVAIVAALKEECAGLQSSIAIIESKKPQIELSKQYKSSGRTWETMCAL